MHKIEYSPFIGVLDLNKLIYQTRLRDRFLTRRNWSILVMRRQVIHGKIHIMHTPYIQMMILLVIELWAKSSISII